MTCDEDRATTNKPPKIEKQDGKLNIEGGGEFYPTTRIVQIEATDLQITHDMQGGGKNDKASPFVTKIIGNGVIDRDEGLGVIGYKDTYSKEVSILIRGVEGKSLKERNSKFWTEKIEYLNKNEKELFRDFKQFLDSEGDNKLYTSAHMGFVPEDFEFGCKECFWLDLSIPNTMMERLLGLISSDKMGGLRISTHCDGLYTDSIADNYTNFPMRFLFAPNETELNSFSMSDIPSTKLAQGYICSFYMLEKKHQFESEDKEDEDDFLIDEDEGNETEKLPNYSNGISNITDQIVNLKKAANGVRSALWVAIIIFIIYALNQ